MPVTINGDGLIEVGGTSTTQGRVRLAEDTDNGSNYVELTAPASVTANRTVTFPDANVDFSTGLGVAQGGTGATTLTANNVLLGNGTSAVQVVAPGTNGNILTSNGTTWTSAAPASSFVGFRGQAFTSNGTFTIPTGITALKITVVGGGGGGAGAVFAGCCAYNPSQGAGGGGAGISFLTGLTPGNTLSVTIGGGGAGGGSASNGSSGGNSTVASGTQSITTITGGGGGGSTSNTFIPGAGGTATNGTINIAGQGGGAAGTNTAGNGGSSILGGGGRGGRLANGTAGGAYGGGGGGASGAGAYSGGAGAAGIVVFEW
jgi:hypothetical protein